jgi:hypothetical protein
MPSGSTIVVVACLMTEQLELAMRSLVENGQRLVLVRVGDIRVPDIPKLDVMSIPADLSEQRRTTRHRYARHIHVGAVSADG